MDLSPGMLKHLVKKGIYNKVEAHDMSKYPWPFASNKYDGLMCNGVLIYVLLADRDVEIVADRGVHARVGAQEWQTICHTMEEAFRQGTYREGAISGVQAVAQLLKRHFPACRDSANELPDSPAIL